MPCAPEAVLIASAQTAEAAARGDDAALTELVRAYHDRVYRFGVRVCRDPADADDAVQEAFMKLARRPDVQRDPGALSWLMTVVKNTCLRLLRPFAGERVPLTQTPVEQVDPMTPERALERWQTVDRVRALIAALPAPAREVLVLRDIEGLSGPEVARVLGISEEAMKSRLHRARSLVRQGLEEAGENPRN